MPVFHAISYYMVARDNLEAFRALSEVATSAEEKELIAEYSEDFNKLMDVMERLYKHVVYPCIVNCPVSKLTELPKSSHTHTIHRLKVLAISIISIIWLR